MYTKPVTKKIKIKQDNLNSWNIFIKQPPFFLSLSLCSAFTVVLALCIVVEGILKGILQLQRNMKMKGKGIGAIAL